MNVIKGILAVVIAFLGLTIFFGSWYQVSDYERVVLTRNGAVVGTVGPGLHFKLPIIDEAHYFSLRDNVKDHKNLEAYTRDQQTATITNISVNYRIHEGDIEEIYRRFGSTENMVSQLVSKRIGETLEQVFGQYNAERAVVERTKLGQEFTAAIRQVNGPIEITSVQIENFSFPDEYEHNINQRMAAEVKAKQAEEQAKATITDAKAEAEARLLKAKAEADAIRLAGEAEAHAMREQGEALRQFPDLVKLTAAKTWNGILPATMVPNGAVPFVEVPAGR